MDNSSQVIRTKATSKKMLFIVIVFAVVAILTFITAITGFSFRELLDAPIIFNVSISEILKGSGIENLVETAATTVDALLTAYRLVKWLPNLAVALSWFFIFFGAKRENPGLFSLGFLVFKIESFYQLFSMTVVVLLGFVASIAIGLPVGLVLLVLILLVGSNILAFLYYFKVLKMSYAFSLTYKTGVNRVYVYKYILFYMMYYAVISFWGVLTGLIGGDVMGALSKLAIGLVYVFLFVLMREYRDEVGNAEPQKVRDIALYRLEEKALGGAAPKAAAAPRAPRADGVRPAATPRPAVSRRVGKNAGARLSAAIAAVSDGESFAESDEELQAKVIKLFDADAEVLSDSFVVLGKETYTEKKDNPASVVALQVVKDSISERKILRCTVRNHSSAVVSSVVLQIVPVGHLGNRLGVMNDVQIDAGTVESGQTCLSEYGVILPDAFSAADVRIVKVVFDNGLYWDRGSESCTIASFEKKTFDKKLFMEYYNG